MLASKKDREEIKMEASKHFVLVHGICQGAWCWFKLIPLLKAAGHKVTALDMAASGVNMNIIEDVHTFEDYNKPLLDFMASLSDDGEQVILVVHSLGGMNIAFAMEYFTSKISAAVFLTALVPDTLHQPSYVIDKFVELGPQGGWMDTKFWTQGSPEEPMTTTLIGPQFLHLLSSLSPVQDYELAKALQRPSSLFAHDLRKAKKFTNEGYGSVRRIYVISKEDKGFTEEFVGWMIENSGVEEIKVVEGADHMTMFSQPQLLSDCLLDITTTS